MTESEKMIYAAAFVVSLAVDDDAFAAAKKATLAFYAFRNASNAAMRGGGELEPHECRMLKAFNNSAVPS